jgi:hypothetical protein
MSMSYKNQQHKVKRNRGRVQTLSPIERITDITKQKPLFRTLTYQIVVNASSAIQGFSLTWCMDNIDTTSKTALQSLFDQYRVMHYTVSWIPAVTDFVATSSATASSTYAAAAPLVWSALDFDDGYTVPTLSTIAAYSTVRYLPVTKIMRRTVQPVLRGEYSPDGSATSSYFTLKGSQSWVDLIVTNTQWLGQKWLIAGVPGIGETRFQLGTFEFEAYVGFRQNR